MTTKQNNQRDAGKADDVRERRDSEATLANHHHRLHDRLREDSDDDKK